MLQLGRYEADGKMNPSLKPMDPDPLAWNDLKLPNDESTERTLESLGQARKGHKNIIKSLVDKHFAKDMEFDLVRDKGVFHAPNPPLNLTNISWKDVV